MKKNTFFFFHRITYWPFILIFIVLFSSQTIIMSLLQLPDDIIIFSLGALLLLGLILIGLFDGSINRNNYLKIHLNRNSYIVGDFICSLVYSIFSTILLSLTLLILYYLKIISYKLPLYIYITFALILFTSNRIFYLLSFLFKKYSIIIIIAIGIILIKYTSTELITFTFNTNKIKLILIICSVLVFCEIIIIYTIRRINLFKKSLSDR